MNILMIYNCDLPPVNYGGTERVIWSLTKGLSQLNHNVYLFSQVYVECPWAKTIIFDSSKPIDDQIPDYIDIVHFHTNGSTEKKPYVITKHGNNNIDKNIDPNTIFVSRKHAANHGGEAFVYNGLDWSEYLQPNLNKSNRDERCHFLGKAAWRLKNVQGAINIAKKAKIELDVLGGYRLNLKMGFRFTFDRHVKFHGMVNNATKCKVMDQSKGLIFPVTWEEPFGLAVTESLFMGTPVFATPYGSLPELIRDQDLGFISNVEDELVSAVRSKSYNPKYCNEYARDTFDHLSMAKCYIEKYESVINGTFLNNFTPKPMSQLRNLSYFKKLPYR
ncbi:glycosyltransferase [Enterovibrio norvegicus]|uniref:Glycosyl transferase n=1 Tax=Enterovibrio norvegicus TaxID=188144 RepID=A0A2N7LEB7_9GAMM|nr:glycosyltransferase [Enterovibrio norvegicus]PML79733.1 glycosyl transferase [Enterovibrio norvegicus]PMN93740.1 glycosyl transferase [Enterovibrio norvegicus]